MPPTARTVTSLLAALALLAACESADEKCARARDEAQATWTSYVVSLESAMEDARDTQRTGKEQMSAHEQRLSEPVKRDADARYERASGAWMRAFESGMHKACSADPDCDELKQALAKADDVLDEVGQRLEPAKRAQAAMALTVDEAKQASEAVPIHAGYPVAKAAQASTGAMAEQCEDLPPPKPDESP